MEKHYFDTIKVVYEAFSAEVDGFYLAGGTALSMHYFQHRASFDLDFFTQEFSFQRIDHIMNQLSKKTNVNIKLIEEQATDNFAKLRVYDVMLNNQSSCKVDFVQDFLPLHKPLKRINNIDVLSLDDIYARKLYAVAGARSQQGLTGRDMFIGGRQEPKDFFDLFYLSSTFKPLAKFVKDIDAPQYQLEGLMQWYRSFDRVEMKTGLLDLITDNDIDFTLMDKHIHREINCILEDMIGDV